MNYEHFLELIAKKGDLSNPHNIVAAHCISSERQLVRNRFTPGPKTWVRLGVTFTIPSSCNFVASRRSGDYRGGATSPQFPEPADLGFTRMEKAVDHTLVPIITQEF